MPMYAYRCPSCGDEFEDMRSYDDRKKPGPVCVKCDVDTEYVVSGGNPQTFRLKNLWGGSKAHNLGEV